jgi:general secretion pathway protein F
MNFSYSAITRDGHPETGHLEAQSKDDAMRQLVHDSKTVVALKVAHVSKNNDVSFRKRGRLLVEKKVDQLRFFDDLTLLTGVGFTLPQALQSMKSTAKRSAEKDVVTMIASELDAGRTASLAFASTGLFSPHILAMIDSGDIARSLPRVFSEISNSLMEEEKARSAVVDALTYPGLLIALMVTALGIVTFGLIPAIGPVFANSGMSTPIAVSVFVSIRVFLIAAWPWICLIGVSCILALLNTTVRQQLYVVVYPAILRMPFLGSIVVARRLTKYLASLGMLLENHAPMAQSLKVAASSVSNPIFQKKLLGIADKVAAGKKLPQAIEETQLFDSRTVSLIAIGYEAGRLPNALQKAAELIAVSNSRRIERAVSFLTPALTIFMGLIIGGLVVSVMTALLAINDLALQ